MGWAENEDLAGTWGIDQDFKDDFEAGFEVCVYVCACILHGMHALVYECMRTGHQAGLQR